MPTTFPRAATLADKLRAIVAAAVDGTPLVRPRVVDVLGGRDSAAAFGELFDDIRTRIRYVRDVGHAEGLDQLQSVRETLQLGSGDCEDLTALVLATARAAGLRGRIATISYETDAGLVPAHVYAEVELRPGEWIAADPTEGPLGTDPATLPAFAGGVREVVAEFPKGEALGFLDGLAGLASSLFASSSQEASAKAYRGAEQAKANALLESSYVQLRNNREEREALQKLVQAYERTSKAEARQQAQQLNTTMEFLREIAPAVLLVIALRFAAPILTEVVR